MHGTLQIEEEGLLQKTAALVFSSIGVIINSTLLCSIIIYEKRKHFRTLINQLVSSILLRALVWNFIVQGFTFFRYTYGPLPYCACYFTTILQTALLMQGLLLFDAIVLVRYSYVFLFSNPTCMQDEFWIAFINIWTVSVSIIAQVTFVLTPGKNPIHFYICVGEIPISELEHSVKLNHSVIALLIASIFLHIFTGIRLKSLKKKTIIEECKYSAKAKNISIVDKESLASVTTNIISMIIFVIASYLPAQLNRIDMNNYHKFPNSLISDIFHHYFPQSQFLVTFFIFYCKNESLRLFLKREYWDTNRIFNLSL